MMRLRDLTKDLNFFRYHLLFFTFTPLIISGIFYAANTGESGELDGTGNRKIAYIDSLFLCFSAMTVTGLVTVNVSVLNPGQQVILMILFIIGDFSFVSWVMVMVRKGFFRKHCEELLRRSNTLHRSRTKMIFDRAFAFIPSTGRPKTPKPHRGEVISGPLNARPVGDYLMEEVADSPVDMAISEGRPSSAREDDNRSRLEQDQSGSSTAQSSAVIPQNGASESAGLTSIHPARDVPTITIPMGRTRTIQITEPDPQVGLQHRQRLRARSRGMSLSRSPLSQPPTTISARPLSSASTHPDLAAIPAHVPLPVRNQHTGLGGFPSPVQLIGRVLPESAKSTVRHRFGRPERRHTLLLSRTHSVNPVDMERSAVRDNSWDSVKATVASWLPEGLGGLVIGRNSRFFSEELNDEELEELGGVEYRALRLLSYLVPAYIILSQLIPFAIIAIYWSKTSRWNRAFDVQEGVQQNNANKSWSALFMVSSGFTGCGMSLIDQGLLPFAASYLVIFVMAFVLLAGNHALPMMLRLLIWLGTKIWRTGRLHETLHFLLDHPRRCFLYLFPSHQTWYLVFVLIAFVAIELFAFLVLNIGLPLLDGLSGFQRFADALIQSLSVRASGFGVVPVSNMAPSVLFIYVILMYVAIYLRSTNVYEERGEARTAEEDLKAALGVYEPEDPEASSETEPAFQGKKHEVFSKYLGWHMRRQLAFDIWPLTFAIFLICIIERDRLMDPTSVAWFTVFRVIFECTSAYATIGLSMGTPNNNFSFTGEFRTLSKLVMILLMLRGRHRGLPVAIDRAVLLPHAYARFDRRATQEPDDFDVTISNPTVEPKVIDGSTRSKEA